MHTNRLYEEEIRELAAEHQMRIEVLEQKPDVHRKFAEDVAGLVRSANARNQPLALILPVGPVKQYPLLADICNRERISWRQVHIFGMDEYLDWQGRPLDANHPLSFKGFLLRRFVDLLDEALRVPVEQVMFPDSEALDAYSGRIAELGGIDCCYGGIGIHGHVAFNESPQSRFQQVSVADFRRSRTRIVPLAAETIVMNSARSAGGRLADFPNLAVTVGMGDILSARRIRLYCDGGEWQKTAVRHAVAGTPGIDYPVSLLRGHPDYAICMDRETAEPAVFHIS